MDKRSIFYGKINFNSNNYKYNNINNYNNKLVNYKNNNINLFRETINENSEIKDINKKLQNEKLILLILIFFLLI